MKGEIGFIGGSGIYNLSGIEIVKEHDIMTPFGKPSSPIIEAAYEGKKCYFLPRHGKGHTLLPHELNYKANIYALKSIGVEYVISVSAVGSLKEELPPNHFVLVDQFIDWTKGKRESSFFGDGVIAHVSSADPIEKKLQNLIAKCCDEEEVEYTKDGTYLCIEGPRFSTRAESKYFKEIGASVIGMTNVPEAFLAKEAGMAYSTIAMVTDYDSWKEEFCTVSEIMKVMESNNKTAQVLIKSVIKNLSNNKFSFPKENKTGLMTPLDSMCPEKKEIASTLLA